MHMLLCTLFYQLIFLLNKSLLSGVNTQFFMSLVFIFDCTFHYFMFIPFLVFTICSFSNTIVSVTSLQYQRIFKCVTSETSFLVPVFSAHTWHTPHSIRHSCSRWIPLVVMLFSLTSCLIDKGNTHILH